MKFSIIKTSDHYEEDKEMFREFKTLEELLGWCRLVGNPVIIHVEENGYELEIYDDYRE